MKRSTVLSFLLIGLIAFAASGCKKKGVGITPIPGRGTRPAITAGPSSDPLLGGGRPLPATGDPQWSETQWSDATGVAATDKPMNTGPQERAALQAETVYFDLDSSLIKSSEQPKLQRVAEYLTANPTHDILIEGHCDERGTEGYNMSLGERRALSAREYLASIGAPVHRVYTTSYGESRPAVEGSGEAVWAKNRRVEFVVVLPAQ